MRSESLCKRCRALDIPKHIHQSMKQPWKFWQALYTSRPAERVGAWEKMCRRASSCPFCRLMVHSIVAAVRSTSSRLPGPRDMIEMSNRASWKMCILTFNFNSITSDRYSNRADLDYEAQRIRRKRGLEAQRLILTWSGSNMDGQIQWLASPEANVEFRGVCDGTFLGRSVDTERPDWSLLRSWLRHCDRCHGKLCEAAHVGSAGERLPKTMRVIDVQGKSVVPYLTGWDYVALTYVWGEQLMGRRMATMDKERASGLSTSTGVALPSWLPKTVVDAMETVERLGYRYLWVDSLCIVQDDDEDRHGQLLRMDAIYTNASLTIAAASGGHADCGLPGLSVPRKFRQQRAMVQGVKLAVPMPRFDELNNGTQLKWNTRAWTFQEKVLSRRLLIFTDHQIYFRCSNGVWSEDTATETSRLAYPNGKRFFRWANDNEHHGYYPTRNTYSLVDFLSFGSRRLAGVDRRAGFVNYAAVVEEYTQRTLTYHRDALPAIEGVLRVIDDRPSAHVAGLPRWFFPEAMLWQPKLGSTCVEVPGTGAPTWSWARWALPDGCTWHARDIKHTKRLQSRPMFYWTAEAGPLPIAFHHPASSRVPRTPRRIRHCLQESGAVLGLGVRLGYLAVGETIAPRPSRQSSSDETVAAFSLHLKDQNELGTRDLVGEVVTTAASWKNDGDLVFVEISQGTELGFASGLIADRFRPSTTRDVWIPEEKTTDSDGNTITIQAARWEKQITVDPPSTWKVMNVMMIERANGLSYRRGVGKVMHSAWYTMDTHRTMAYLA